MRFIHRPVSWPFYGFGGLYLLLFGGYLQLTAEPRLALELRGLLVVILAVALFLGGFLFRTLDPDRSAVVRSGFILGLGSFFGTSISGYIFWVESATVTVDGLAYTMLAAGAGATVLATPIAYYYVTSRQQVTELQTRYAESERMRKQLSILDRVLRHNLRTELNIILGWVEALDSPKSPSDRYAREKIDQHIERLEEIGETAGDIREVYESERRVRQAVPTVVSAALESLHEDLPEVRISSDVDNELEVLAHTRLEEAIGELVDNAVRHNDPVDLHVSITAQPAVDESGDEMCLIRIRDTGSGMPANEVAALEQVEETPLSHSRGLGLWFVVSVVEQSGGVVTMPGVEDGTVVELRLPLA